MGGSGSGRKPSANSVLKNLRKAEPKTPIADEMFIPNLSGDLSSGIVRTTPTQDLNPANKKYVDDAIDADILTHIGTAQAHTDYMLNTGDTSTGNYDFTAGNLTTTGDISVDNIIITGNIYEAVDNTLLNVGGGSSAFNGAYFQVSGKDRTSHKGSLKFWANTAGAYGGTDDHRIIFGHFNGTATWTRDLIIEPNGDADFQGNNIITTGRISTGTATITASSDTTDVSGINTLFINITGDIVLGGLVGGVDGQVINIVAIGNFVNHCTIEHAEGIGGATQDFINHVAADEDISHGGSIYVCNGTNWYDASHARHV